MCGLRLVDQIGPFTIGELGVMDAPRLDCNRGDMTLKQKFGPFCLYSDFQGSSRALVGVLA